MSNKVNQKAPTEAQKKKKDPLAKKRNAAKILALILAVVMVLVWFFQHFYGWCKEIL